MDYLIRLMSKSVDAADECLCKCKKLVEDPRSEVVRMLINHFPDPSLALQSTLQEVQDRLDDHIRKMKRCG